MLAFLNQLEKEPNIGPFLEPVDWKALGLQDYPKIVKKPMDLRTIREKVKQDVYANFDMFYADVSLVWNNCKSYNIAESEIYRMAEDLERTSKKMYKKVATGTKKRTRDEKGEKSQEDEEEDDEGDISFDDRIKFTDYVRKLTIEQMTTLVKMIQETSPSVLEDLDTDKLQIRVNDISKEHFEKYMSYVQAWGTKDGKGKLGGAEEENSKSNNEEVDDPMGAQSKSSDKGVKKEATDEEAKNDNDSASKFGPEAKRFKTE